MPSTASINPSSNISHAPHTLPASGGDGAHRASRAVWVSTTPWQSAPAGFADYSAVLSAISPRLRTTRRFAVDSASPLQRSVREAFEALGLLGGQQRLEEARVTQLFVSGHDGQALRALATLAEAGILNLGLRLNNAALHRQFFAGETLPDALRANTTLAALLSLKGRELGSVSGSMSLIDRFMLLKKAGFDLSVPARNAPGSARRLLQAIGCCVAGTTTPAGPTLLHLAAGAGNLDATRALAAAGLDINATDARHFTPLMCAAESGRADTARTLLDLGADTETASEPGSLRAAHLAALANSADTLQALADHHANMNAPAEKNLTPVHVAAGLAKIDALRTLAALGCDLEAQCAGRNTLTPLAFAALQGTTESIAALAALNTSMDTPMMLGRTALHLATLENKPEGIAALHQHGATLDLPDEQGNTALHLAAVREKKQAGDALIGAGCNLNLRNNYGERPVDAAGSRSNPVMYSKLVAAGAEGPHRYVPRPQAGGI